VSYDRDTISALRPTGVEKLQLARQWFDESQDATRKPALNFLCHEDTCASCTPTRLIYLGESQQYPPPYVRLVCSWSDHEHRAETPRYIALSHRWGPSQHLKTTKSNYMHHLLGIKFSHLPQTFQDAAAVALCLGIRHLWIDALCIVQDDSTDWHREALLMGQVYESAVCTIAAHNARDDTEGFLGQSLLPPPLILLGDKQKGGLFYVSLRSNFKADVDNSQLSGRGWVLQERFLSPRTLHFTQESIFFDDACGVKSEEDSLRRKLLLLGDHSALGIVSENTVIPRKPWLDVNLPIDEKNPLWNFAVMLSVSNDYPVCNVDARTAFNISYKPYSGDIKDLLIRWFEIVERYCKTDLTFETDKLPAISGLARYIQNHTGDQYCSGIWESQFHLGLLWAPGSQGVKRPMSIRAPSWSWASVDGPVQYPGFRGDIDLRSRLIRIEPHGDAFYASSASITLHAKLKQVRHIQQVTTVRNKLLYKSIPNTYPIMREHSASDTMIFPMGPPREGVAQHLPSSKTMGWYAIDDITREYHLEEVYCARIASFFSIDVLLVLCPTGKDQNQYRRVGVGIIGSWREDNDFWDNARTVTFTIV
jgi:hypothetical protein